MCVCVCVMAGQDKIRGCIAQSDLRRVRDSVPHSDERQSRIVETPGWSQSHVPSESRQRGEEAGEPRFEGQSLNLEIDNGSRLRRTPNSYLLQSPVSFLARGARSSLSSNTSGNEKLNMEFL